jgi:hypothetical protein
MTMMRDCPLCGCREYIGELTGDDFDAMEADFIPAKSIAAAKRHHEKHGDMDGETCLLSACALHYPLAVSREASVPQLTCAHCENPATCFGEYETCEGVVSPACDTCCGHGGEDGWCRPIAEIFFYANGKRFNQRESCWALSSAPAERSEPAAASVPLTTETEPARRNFYNGLGTEIDGVEVPMQADDTRGWEAVSEFLSRRCGPEPPVVEGVQTRPGDLIIMDQHARLRVAPAPPAVSSEASVPPGGEFTPAEVEAAANEVDGTGLAASDVVQMLRAYAAVLRALSSAPGERT